MSIETPAQAVLSGNVCMGCSRAFEDAYNVYLDAKSTLETTTNEREIEASRVAIYRSGIPLLAYGRLEVLDYVLEAIQTLKLGRMINMLHALRVIFPIPHELAYPAASKQVLIDWFHTHKHMLLWDTNSGHYTVNDQIKQSLVAQYSYIWEQESSQYLLLVPDEYRYWHEQWQILYWQNAKTFFFNPKEYIVAYEVAHRLRMGGGRIIQRENLAYPRKNIAQVVKNIDFLWEDDRYSLIKIENASSDYGYLIYNRQTDRWAFPNEWTEIIFSVMLKNQVPVLNVFPSVFTYPNPKGL